MIPLGILGSSRASSLDAYASAVMADSPLAYWRLNETSGTTAADSSGNARHGTYAGSYTLGTTGISGRKAATFASTGTVSTPAPTWTPTTGYTIEGFIRATAAGNFPTVFRADNWTILRLDTSAARPGFYTFDSSGYSLALTPTSQSLGTWLHVAATYSSAGQMRLYVNGTLDAGPTAGRTRNQTPLAGTCAGGSGEYLVGQLCEVAIYGTELSSARIAAHYAAA